ncbi:DNA-directed RNA polymerase subunit delta [Levilactobacillus bambusae]|uniref:Probable DNA-directed RNA polymerase subunit delta n=1 Tax=Levilactobacillus bambusae TaxID=2024736 RepID=A0A2V1MW49_9LACO|nr:DNA-directed RNA polymerase subunit delta [Levilactobacillus bambusae]PWF99316.1 DNA-directed RNA polymerase subunit delta [Levilactobacillus bambusae]
MELKVFEGQNKNELSMIEVAHAILSNKGDVMPFADLVNQVQQYMGTSDGEIRDRLSQFYTDLNIDGSFISLGDNLWGLRTWYPYESIDEATVHMDEEEDMPKRKKRKKVNAFLDDASDDDDVIDYDDDDPEDQELVDEEDNDNTEDDTADETYVDDQGVAEDHEADLGKYQHDLEDIDAQQSADDEEDDDLPDGIEGQLSELDPDDDHLDDEEN